MKKYFISFAFVAALLLSSNNALACSVHINVTNNSTITLHIAVSGPAARESDTWKLDVGEYFTYHATGSLFSCHGKYTLVASGKSFSLVLGTTDLTLSNATINASKDGWKYAKVTDPDATGNYQVTWSD